VRRSVAMMALTALIAAACTGTGGGVRPESSPTPATTTSTTPPATTTTLPPSTTTTEPRPPPCPSPVLPAPDPTPPARIPSGDPAAAAIRVSRATFACNLVVVITAGDDLDTATLAARLAAGLGAPLLFGDGPHPGGLAAELARLGPARVLAVGAGLDLAVPGWTVVERLPDDPADLAAAVARELGLEATVALPADAGAGTIAALAGAIVSGTVPAAAEVAADDATTTTTTAATAEPESDPAAPPGEVIVGAGGRGAVWLVSHQDPLLALAPIAAAATSGDLAAVVDAADLRRNLMTARAMQAGHADAVYLVGGFGEDADWQLPVILSGNEIPGGGYLLFPGRRIVALYGNPLTPVLGVMGEQPPAEAAQRARDIAAPYAEEGITLVPAFEIIATVADSRPGGDGNYSNEMEIDLLRPWVDAAAAGGLYVLLDLQPGRTDFLTQAQQYEELLREPHVGLALDPEWRLGPDQVHLRQFGSVTADEVNLVADWLAGLVREHHLPQKMLLLHQFRLSMIPDRGDVAVGPELVLVIQMDGQGPIQTKYETWAAITAGTGGAGWWWGWKNFYDEDSPTPTPEQVLALEPTVVYVSYQ